MQINHNMAALNAWRNLGISQGSLGKTLEKLSSGYRINRGSDDPAGLLISEQLRAQIGGMDQAGRNASDAVSMVQTAEGALTEMNTMLNSIRALAVHASNTGANDTNSVAADQIAVDKAVASIQRIATTTRFSGKNLLDGTAGTKITDALGTTLDGSKVGVVNTSGNVNLVVSTIAHQASASFNINSLGAGAFSTGANGTISVWLEIGGVAQTSHDYIVASGQYGTSASLIAVINLDSSNTLLRASSAAAGNTIDFLSTEYGTNVVLKVSVTGILEATLTSVAASGTGVNVGGTVDGVTFKGSGLVLYGSSASTWAGTEFNLLSGAAGALATYVVSIAVGDLKFSLTEDGSSANLISYGIANMQTANLGFVSTLGGSKLSAIASGQAYQLSANPAGAVSIIDQAINDVSAQRSALGSFQKYTLETTINSLGITRENLAASESRIRDVDMAQAMMEFTKNQILVQAGTAMLAQANQLPSSILQLLK